MDLIPDHKKERQMKRIVAVIGGGASGCMAAIAAAREGAEVHLFEKNEKPAKKIYATGNGRCNLTNLQMDTSCYHTGTDQENDRLFRGDQRGDACLRSALLRFSEKDLIHFFADLGVPVHDRGGYVYPRTDQAQTIARALEKQLAGPGIHLHTGCVISRIDLFAGGGEAEGGALREGFRITWRDGREDSGSLKTQPRSRKGSGPVQTQPRSREDSGSLKAQPRSGKESGPVQTQPRSRKGSVPLRTQPRHRKESGAVPNELTGELFHVMNADAVILCTGGMAGPQYGSTGDGYRFAGLFSHRIRRPLPALTGLVCDCPFLRRAAGVRCHARVTLSACPHEAAGGHAQEGPYETAGSPAQMDFHEAAGEPAQMDFHEAAEAAGGPAQERSLREKPAACEEGEVQMTEYGISGIPVMQLSGAAARLLDAGRRPFVQINFLPEFTDAMFEKETEDRLGADRGQILSDLFLGLVHHKVLDLLLAQKGLQAEMKARRLQDSDIREIMEMMRDFSLEVTGVRPFEQAQVTTGGIPLEEVDEGFQSRLQPGLFFAGEILDVDGRCGGYNLQWAFSSGFIAGKSAAVRL